MLPISPSYAITIHKSQGQTLDKIILNLGEHEFSPGLTYTALSRAKKLQDIALDMYYLVNIEFIYVVKIGKSTSRCLSRLVPQEATQHLPL